jgi:hypothetical protein
MHRPGRLEGSGHLAAKSEDGRTKEPDLRVAQRLGWINLDETREQRRNFVDTAGNILIQKTAGNFLTGIVSTDQEKPCVPKFGA